MAAQADNKKGVAGIMNAKGKKMGSDRNGPGRILSVPPVGERTAPHPALSPSDGERGEGSLAAGSRAASDPSPLSI